jgi:hypothetical protein
MSHLATHAQQLHARWDELAQVAVHVPALKQQLLAAHEELADREVGVAELQVGGGLLCCFTPFNMGSAT